MGLDFSHSEARWSYGGFNRARTRLAAVFGFELNRMQGFGNYGQSGAQIPWPDADKNPIVHLLYHSDCDGDLSVEQCKAVAPVLRDAVSRWPEDDFDKEQFLLLADGMDKAVANNEPLVFE